jgi:hypothetical protein
MSAAEDRRLSMKRALLEAATHPERRDYAEKARGAARDYAEKFHEAARRANAAYLDGLAVWGGLREAQEYDNLNPAGQAVWRAVVVVAVDAMQDD